MEQTVLDCGDVLSFVDRVLLVVFLIGIAVQVVVLLVLKFKKKI